MTTNDHNEPRGTSAPSALSTAAAADLESLTAALTVLAELGNERMTVRQALFFTALAYREAMGHTATVPLIRDAYPILGRAAEKHKETLLDATKRFPDALGWAEQHISEDDRRHRHLKLTDEGMDAASAIVEALRQVK